MSRGLRAALARRIQELRDRAAEFAARREALRGMTTPAIERATLRLLGINGLDANGDPLAASVVERAAGAGPDGLGAGTALPLAAAAVARGLGVQEAALSVAGGEIDIGLEAEFLQDPERRAAAERQLADWTAEAFERIDANRTARHELGDALGGGERPWLGARVGAVRLDHATSEVRGFVSAGAQALVVRVPRGRELLPGAREIADERLPANVDPPPAGSQRGLAALRSFLDELAAEGGAYLLLATATDGLAAPEQAVVAGFERVDLVFADPFDEIALGVDPQRAFVDHAASQLLLGRSGAVLVLGPGPLLAGPEIARGEALAALTRVGRSIAAQAASAAWAGASGLAPGQVMLEVPFEVPTAAPDAALLLAEVTVRRMLHPGHGLAISEPSGTEPEAWRLALPLCLAAGGQAQLVVHGARPDGFASRAAESRAAAAFAQVLGRALPRVDLDPPLPLGEAVFALALDLTAVAAETLETAAAEGWEPLVGSVPLVEGAAPAGPSAAGVVPRRDYAGPMVATAAREGG